MMDKEEITAVPENSFADERDVLYSTNTAAPRTAELSSLATSTNGRERRWKSSDTPPQSVQSNTHEVSDSTRSVKLLSEISSYPSESDISPSISLKMQYDMDMLRSGYSTLYQLKSRLYNRPSESEVFKTINCTNKGQRIKKVCQVCLDPI